MLISQSLVELLQKWADNKLPKVEITLLQEKVMPMLFQCLVQVLQSQEMDGSRGSRGPKEETAYAILSLTSLQALPSAQNFRTDIISAIDRGRSYLKCITDHSPENLWIEKVSYGSKFLAEAYTIAALYKSTSKPSLSCPKLQFSAVDTHDLVKFTSRADRVPFSADTKWVVMASWILSRLYVPLLRKRLDRPILASHRKTAFIWILANNKNQSSFSVQPLLDVITASIRVDEIIALVDQSLTLQDQKQLIALRDAFLAAITYLGEHNPISEPNSSKSSDPAEVVDLRLKGGSRAIDELGSSNGIFPRPIKASDTTTTLALFIEVFSNRSSLKEARGTDETTLRLELTRFVSAQISRIKEQERRSSGESVFNCWKSNADDMILIKAIDLTGFPLLIAFATCLKSQKGENLLPAVSQKYIAKDVRQCVATNFCLESEMKRTNESIHAGDETESRHRLASILAFERERLDLTFKCLENAGLCDDVLKTMKLVADAAKLGGKLLDIDL